MPREKQFLEFYGQIMSITAAKLFKIQRDILLDILGSWLYANELACFDWALVNKRLRKHFLEVIKAAFFSSEGLHVDSRMNETLGYYTWLKLRNIGVRRLFIRCDDSAMAILRHDSSSSTTVTSVPTPKQIEKAVPGVENLISTLSLVETSLSSPSASSHLQINVGHIQHIYVNTTIDMYDFIGHVLDTSRSVQILELENLYWLTYPRLRRLLKSKHTLSSKPINSSHCHSSGTGGGGATHSCGSDSNVSNTLTSTTGAQKGNKPNKIRGADKRNINSKTKSATSTAAATSPTTIASQCHMSLTHLKIFNCKHIEDHHMDRVGCYTPHLTALALSKVLLHSTALRAIHTQSGATLRSIEFNSCVITTSQMIELLHALSECQPSVYSNKSVMDDTYVNHNNHDNNSYNSNGENVLHMPSEITSSASATTSSTTTSCNRHLQATAIHDPANSTITGCSSKSSSSSSSSASTRRNSSCCLTCVKFVRNISGEPRTIINTANAVFDTHSQQQQQRTPLNPTAGSDSNINQLVDCIAATCPRLVTLCVVPAWETESIGNTNLIRLAQQCPHIHTLDISGSKRITEDCICAVVQLLPHLKTLICQDCSGVTDRCVAAIALYCTQLQHLDLSWCHRITNRAIHLLIGIDSAAAAAAAAAVTAEIKLCEKEVLPADVSATTTTTTLTTASLAANADMNATIHATSIGAATGSRATTINALISNPPSSLISSNLCVLKLKSCMHITELSAVTRLVDTCRRLSWENVDLSFTPISPGAFLS